MPEKESTQPVQPTEVAGEPESSVLSTESKVTEDLLSYGYHNIGGAALQKDPLHYVDL